MVKSATSPQPSKATASPSPVICQSATAVRMTSVRNRDQFGARSRRHRKREAGKYGEGNKTDETASLPISA
jgi:hypothetical protein